MLEDAGYAPADARRRCGELAVALGLASYEDDNLDEPARPWMLIGALVATIFAAVAALLSMENGKGLALIAESWQTVLVGVMLLPVFASLKGNVMITTGD